MKRAVVLLSGGLDSATTLYIAKRKGYSCLCLTFDYGQRHKREIGAAEKIARRANCKFRLVKFSLPWKGSSLIDKNINIPAPAKPRLKPGAGRIPNTYVASRNTIFLSFALSYAEAAGACAIFIGANALDYSGYPDCRREFFRAFSRVIAKGTMAALDKKKIRIETPLIGKTKAGIIKWGRRLGVPFELTWSCYRGGATPCGRCDSCYFRAKGFKEAGLKDPLLYALSLRDVSRPKAGPFPVPIGKVSPRIGRGI